MLPLFILLSQAFTIVHSECYYPNGVDRNRFRNFTSDRYLPCLANKNQFSMCCRTNDTSGPPDECRDDGLCYSTATGFLWRESCSDPTWQDPSCLKLCLDTPNADTLVTRCQDGSFCCGGFERASQCCDEKRGVLIKDGRLVNVSSTTSNASISATGTVPSTATSPTLSTSSLPVSKDPRDSTSIITGSIVGGLAALIVVCVATLVFVHMRRKDRPSKREAEANNSPETSWVVSELPTRTPLELHDGRKHGWELEAPQKALELAGPEPVELAVDDKKISESTHNNGMS